MPEISIIVPVYNAENYLDNCIKSILNQTFEDFELILVNDGSTDKSSHICNYYKKIDSRIKLINKKNGGVSSARNKGLEVAIGKYIGFVDSDDYIHPKMYETLYNYIKKKKCDISMCNYKKVNNYNKVNLYTLNEKVLKEPTLEYSNIESLEQLYEKDAVKFIVPWNKLYKKELFINNRYKIGRIHEDEFIVHKLLYEAKKLIYIPIDLYFYYQSQNSIMRKVFDLNRLDLLSAYIERIEFFKHIKEKSLEDKAIFMYSEEFLRHYYLVKNSITNCKKELIKIKFKYILIMPRILRLSYYTKKEKIVLMSFCINNNIYESYMKKRRRM